MTPASESLLAAALPGVISNPVVNAISNLNLAPQDVAPPLQNGVDIPEFGQVISNLGKLAFDASLTIANRLQGTGVLGRLGRLTLEILARVLDTSRLLLAKLIDAIAHLLDPLLVLLPTDSIRLHLTEDTIDLLDSV